MQIESLIFVAAPLDRRHFARIAFAAGALDCRARPQRLHANPECANGLDRIELEAGRLNSLIGSLLRLARLESGSEPLEGEPIPLNRVVVRTSRRMPTLKPKPQSPRARDPGR